MKNKIYFHIGCTYSKEKILRRLSDRGYNIYVLDEIGLRSDALKISYESIFGLPFEDVVSRIKEIAGSTQHDIEDCNFFTLAEGSVELLNQILHYFSKDPISEQRQGFRSKFFVRNSLKRDSIEHLNYLKLVTGPAEIPDPPTNAYPLIVKPTDSMESRNVFKVNNHSELRRACIEIFTKNKTFITADHGEIVVENVYNNLPHALIESTLHGQKLSVEVLVHKGVRRFHAVVTKYDFDNEYFYERADIIDPNYLTREEDALLVEYIERIIRSLKVQSALLHIELFHQKNSPISI